MPVRKYKDKLLKAIENCTHVVIKIGTSTITPWFTENPQAYFDILAEQIRLLQNAGKKVVLISSGAVGLGKRVFKGEQESYSLVEKQALASLGQSVLIDYYRNAFERQQIQAAQILVAKDDFNKREHYRNLKNTLDQLLSWQCVPVINENDAVATEALRFGDNDLISALVSSMYRQTFLIILTSTDGFYMNNEKVDLISEITDEHLAHVGAPSKEGSGGMGSKLQTAGNVLQSGQFLNISAGDDVTVLSRIMQAEPCGTWFFSEGDSKLAAKKRWLLHSQHISGEVFVDAGAQKALREQTASLLAVGVNNVKGNFEPGEIISISSETNRNFARGTSERASEDLKALLAGGRGHNKQLVHRDNLVLLQGVN